MFASCGGVRTAPSVPSGPSEAPELLTASNGIVVVFSCSVHLTEKDVNQKVHSSSAVWLKNQYLYFSQSRFC